MAYQVAVCGPAECTEPDRANARRVGELLAAADAVVICGGGPGVMAAAAAGARSGGGVVVGVLPHDTRADASADLSVAVVTNMGQARNAIIVSSADAVIVVGGSWGTLSELALAMRRRRGPSSGGPAVVSLDGWRILDRSGRPIPGVLEARDAEDAVTLALRARS